MKKIDVLTCVSRSTFDYYRGIGVNAVYIPNAIDFWDLPSESIRLYDKWMILLVGLV